MFKGRLQDFFFDNLSHSTSLYSLKQHILDGTALPVSDGSFYPSHHIGACAWIISTPDLSEWIQGGCIIPGPLDIHSAYRAEIGGLVGTVLCFSTIVLQDSVSREQTVISDCTSSLNNFATSSEYTKTSFHHMDLISIIYDLWSTSPFTPVSFHVYAQQDDNNFSSLIVETKLKYKMDYLAKNIALNAIVHNNLRLHPPSSNQY